MRPSTCVDTVRLARAMARGRVDFCSNQTIFSFDRFRDDATALVFFGSRPSIYPPIGRARRTTTATTTGRRGTTWNDDDDDDVYVYITQVRRRRHQRYDDAMTMMMTMTMTMGGTATFG